MFAIFQAEEDNNWYLFNDFGVCVISKVLHKVFLHQCKIDIKRVNEPILMCRERQLSLICRGRRRVFCNLFDEK